MYHLLLLALLLSYTNIGFSSEKVVVWLGGLSEPLQHYYRDIIQASLDVTTEEFGECTIIDSPYGYMSEIREQALLHTGKIHIQATTNWYNPGSKKQLSQVKKSTLKGLLGIRSLIVRKQDADKFGGVNSYESLKKFTAGLGTNWQDVNILRSNGIEVFEGLGIDTLFKMLALGRFDYLPLGVLEDKKALVAHSQSSDEFIILPNIYIFYRLPVNLYTSDTISWLNMRLEKGLTIIENTGKFEKIYSQHFQHAMNRISAANSKVISLDATLKYAPFE